MRYNLILIRRGLHCIIHIIFYEVRPVRGRGIEIFTWNSYGFETSSRSTPQFNYNWVFDWLKYCSWFKILLLDELLRCLKELSLVKLRRLVQLIRRSQIMIVIVILEKHLSMGIETLTLKDQQLAMMLLGIDMVLVLAIRNL